MLFPWPIPVCSASLNLSGSATVSIPSHRTEKNRIALPQCWSPRSVRDGLILVVFALF
jgi:hypothetical protein